MGSSVLVVLSVLALQLGVSHSAPSGVFFSINDSFLLSYQSWEQRNVLVDQVKSIWSKVLNETWQASNVEVTLISEQDTPQNVSTSNGPVSHRVSSQVTGWSPVSIPEQEALLKFKTALKTSGVAALQAIIGSPGAVVLTGSGNQGSSSFGSDSGNAMKTFQLTDTIILSYTTSAQRDTFLSQVEVFFRNSLNDYQPTNVTLTLLGESDLAAGEARHVHLIEFRVTGQARLPVDIPRVKAAVRQTTRDSHLSGTTDADWKVYETTTSDVEDAGGVTVLSSEAETSSNATSLSAGSVKTASTTPSSVGAVVLSSVTAAAGTAASKASPSIAESSFATATGASTTVAATSGNSITDATTSVAPSAPAAGGDHTIQTTDAAIITYSSSAERDQLLEQIRAKWEAALNQFNVKFTVTVTFVNEEVSGSGHRVVYKISASSPDSIHTAAGKPVTEIVKTVKQTVMSTIGAIPSVKTLTPEEQTKFDTSSENIDNQFNKPGAAIPPRSVGDVLVASASATSTTIASPSEAATSTSSSSAVTVSSVSSSVSVTSASSAPGTLTTAAELLSVGSTIVPSASVATNSAATASGTSTSTATLPSTGTSTVTSASVPAATGNAVSEISTSAAPSFVAALSTVTVSSIPSSVSVNTASPAPGISTSAAELLSIGSTIVTIASAATNSSTSGSETSSFSAVSSSTDATTVTSASVSAAASGATATNGIIPSKPPMLQSSPTPAHRYRDQLLEQIRAKWEAALNQFNVKFRVTVTFVNEEVSGSGHRVVYKISASSPDSIHTAARKPVTEIVKTVKETVISTIGAIPSVKPLTPEEQKRFDTSSENIDNQFNKPGTDIPARSSGDFSVSSVSATPTPIDSPSAATTSASPSSAVTVSSFSSSVPITSASLTPGASTSATQLPVESTIVTTASVATNSSTFSSETSTSAAALSSTGSPTVTSVDNQFNKSEAVIPTRSGEDVLATSASVTPTPVATPSDATFSTSPSPTVTVSSVPSSVPVTPPDLALGTSTTAAERLSVASTTAFTASSLINSTVNASETSTSTATLPSSATTTVTSASVPAAASGTVSGISTSVAPSTIPATTVISTSGAATFGNLATNATASVAPNAPVAGEDHTIQTTDAAIITYSSSTERDQLLERIRAKWEAALNQFNVKFTVTVKFVNEEVSGSGHRVVYKISASSPDSIHIAAGKPVTEIVKTVKQTVISTIGAIPSVKPLTQEEQTRFETSTENIDNQFNKPGNDVPARSGEDVLVASVPATPTSRGTPSSLSVTVSSVPSSVSVASASWAPGTSTSGAELLPVGSTTVTTASVATDFVTSSSGISPPTAAPLFTGTTTVTSVDNQFNKTGTDIPARSGGDVLVASASVTPATAGTPSEVTTSTISSSSVTVFSVPSSVPVNASSLAPEASTSTAQLLSTGSTTVTIASVATNSSTSAIETSTSTAALSSAGITTVISASVSAAADNAVSGISTSVAPSTVAAITGTSTSVAATSGNPVTNATTSVAPSAPAANGDHTIQTTDAAIITYSSSTERDQLLEQIRAKWEAALNQFNVKFRVTVTFVNEEVSGSGHRVVYKISASSPDSIHIAAGKPVTEIVKTVKQTVISTIGAIPSVKPLTQEEQTRFDTSSENIDNQFNKPGNDVPARSGEDVLVASASATPTTVGTPSEATTSISSSLVVTVASVLSSVPVTSGTVASESSTTASISSSSVPSTGVPSSITTTQPFGVFGSLINTQSDELNVTDSAELAYTTPQERDDLLQQILNLWINALGPFNIGALRITFISELGSGSNGAHTVSYSVTGRTANRTITPQQLTEAVHTDIGGRSRINRSQAGDYVSRIANCNRIAEGGPPTHPPSGAPCPSARYHLP
ncbi:hypothetical protein BV898_15439 [Hypsibius exemplaris]|uniref:SEA domain-containing protein n=1 Tax=Hypsibius exemplaris TaxID=2072580 RepID=A0A9X6NCZ4_HYPEX|nr:hypothetical protein BV898_15439 [Hypsibius exemplaris]